MELSEPTAAMDITTLAVEAAEPFASLPLSSVVQGPLALIEALVEETTVVLLVVYAWKRFNTTL
jgi:hypothetical protein